MVEQSEALIKELRSRAEKLGFDAFGITSAHERPELKSRLQDALDAGHHAEMHWMADTRLRRQSPTALWTNVRSIIMLGMNYGPDTNPLVDLKLKSHGNISVYARQDDYHDIVKGRLKELAGLLARRTGEEVKVFVDTAPVMEKPLAQDAGVGWQGKHTVLLSREFGNWMFLGAIFTSADLPASAQEKEHCGSCTKCLDICPTDAFPAPFQLDASRCLAYYSNEHHGPIPIQFRKPMGNRIFGCDDCLAVCPWNKFASSTRVARLVARDELKRPLISDLLKLDETGFKSLVRKTPIARLGFVRFLRNVLIAAGNSQNDELAGIVEAKLDHPDPVVRGAAVWAIKELTTSENFRRLQIAALQTETDIYVRQEWSDE